MRLFQRHRFAACLVVGCPLVASASLFAQSAPITAAGFSQYWNTSNAAYDLNGDGVVNGQDLAMFLAGATGSSESGGSGTVVVGGGTETPGAATAAAAGPSAPNFLKNGVGVTGPYLLPGSGFASATTAPSQIGEPTLLGGTANAIARWDAVPYRTVNEPVNIGVVAFQIAGIDRVAFSANGGPWVNTSEMRRNPQTGVWEYFVTLRPQDYPDGRVEVRAIVYPKRGVPRVLQGAREGNERTGFHSMVVFANAGGTLPSQERWVSLTGNDNNDGRTAALPMRTIAKAAASIHAAQSGNAGGGFINVMPGTYAWDGAGKDQFGATVTNPTTTERWLTVRRAPGVTADVLFTSNSDAGATRTKMLAVEGCKFQGAHVSVAGSLPNALVWIGNCELKGVGPADTRQWIDSGFVGGLMTQTSVANCATGTNRSFYLRDVHIRDIGKDGFVQVGLATNCSLRNLARPAGQTWHCDVLQLMQTNGSPINENVIMYGFKAFDCASQGLFVDTDTQTASPTTVPLWKDIAFVNYFSEFSQGTAHTAQWNASIHQLLMWNCSLIGGPTWLRESDATGMYVYKDVSIRGSLFTKLGVSPAALAVLDAANNHFVTGSNWGTAFTSGDAMFVNAAANDYRPLPGSPLVGRIATALLPVDADLRLLTMPSNVGSFED